MLTNWQYVVDVLIKIRINRKYVLKMIYCSIKLQLTQFNDTLKNKMFSYWYHIYDSNYLMKLKIEEKIPYKNF